MSEITQTSIRTGGSNDLYWDSGYLVIYQFVYDKTVLRNHYKGRLVLVCSRNAKIEESGCVLILFRNFGTESSDLNCTVATFSIAGWI